MLADPDRLFRWIRDLNRSGSIGVNEGSDGGRMNGVKRKHAPFGQIFPSSGHYACFAGRDDRGSAGRDSAGDGGSVTEDPARDLEAAENADVKAVLTSRDVDLVRVQETVA